MDWRRLLRFGRRRDRLAALREPPSEAARLRLLLEKFAEDRLDVLRAGQATLSVPSRPDYDPAGDVVRSLEADGLMERDSRETTDDGGELWRLRITAAGRAHLKGLEKNPGRN